MVTVDDMQEQLERDGELPVVGEYVYRALYRSAQTGDLARSLEMGRQTL